MITPTPITTKSYFKSLQILHIALTAGLILFSGVMSLFILYINKPGVSKMPDAFNFIVPVISFSGIAASYLVFKTKLISIKDIPSLNDKLNKYREAVILRIALLEGPALITIILAFICNNISYLIWTGMLILTMISRKATVRTAVNDLQLEQQDTATLEDPEAIIGGASQGI